MRMDAQISYQAYFKPQHLLFLQCFYFLSRRQLQRGIGHKNLLGRRRHHEIRTEGIVGIATAMNPPLFFPRVEVLEAPEPADDPSSAKITTSHLFRPALTIFR